MGKYVYRKVANGDDLVEWAKEQGFTSILKPDDLHLTIVYSKTDFEKAPDHNGIGFKGGERAVKRMGDAIVLTIGCKLIARQHAAYLDAGATSDWPTYLQHITITYRNPDMDLSEIEPFRGKIRFTREHQEPLDDEMQEYPEIDL